MPFSETLKRPVGPVIDVGMRSPEPVRLHEIVPLVVVAVAVSSPLRPSLTSSISTTGGTGAGGVSETSTVKLNVREAPAAVLAVTVPLKVCVPVPVIGAKVKVGVADAEVLSIDPGRLHDHDVGVFVAEAERTTLPVATSVSATPEITGGNWTVITCEKVAESPFAFVATALTT